MRAVDITGNRYGHLVVQGFKETRRTSGSGQSTRYWTCLCDCGNTCVIVRSALTSGNNKTCGCKLDSATIKHGMHKHRAYGSWRDMKSRCNDENKRSYPDYGGRGISYEASWSSFDSFWKDMSASYGDNLTLERVNVDGDYSKDNCIWATMYLQSHNRRMTKSNTSGVTGVRWHTDKSNTLYAAGCVVVDGKKKEKHFRVAKFGLLPAFKMAIDYRRQMIEKLNSQGAGYSEKHGL